MTDFPLPRRNLLALPACLLAAAAAAAPVRLGTVQFGTVQWVAETIRRQGLDGRHGFTLRLQMLANTAAGRIALMAGGADIVVADWLFAAAQRAAGTKLCFAPFSTALGGVMVPAASTIRGLADLKGRRLGVAGGPLDKSWLLMQAAAKAGAAIDLGSAARVVYGAPPLLSAKLTEGELDAVLTFWTFAARLEAAGCREAVSVGDCAALLGMKQLPPMVGFVFHEAWARSSPAAVSGFLAAAAEAERLLASSDAAWGSVRPLMDAPADALFRALRHRFVAGIAHPAAADLEREAARVLQVLLHAGGTRATAGLTALPAGLFWNESAT